MTSALIVLQGIATGSLLYVVFFEILEKERQKNVSGIVQVKKGGAWWYWEQIKNIQNKFFFVLKVT